MIRKFGRLGSSRAAVEALFFDLPSWPEWMPGVRSLEVVAQRDAELRARVVQHFAGRDRPGELAIERFPHGMRQRLLRSWIRRWDTTWRFLEPPDGRGTTVALETIIDLGMLGRLMPANVVERSVDRFFRGILAGAEARLRDVRPAGEVLVQLFRTSSGLEVRAGGRTYSL